MVSSIVKSSSIKFVYENKEDNYWKFYTSRVEKVDEENGRHHRHHEHHEHHKKDEKLFLEMKVFVPDVGIVTQKYEVTMDMFNDLSNWLFELNSKS